MADSTCFPAGASVSSCTLGIVISSAGSGEHWPYFAASNACFDVSQVGRDHEPLARELRPAGGRTRAGHRARDAASRPCPSRGCAARDARSRFRDGARRAGRSSVRVGSAFETTVPAASFSPLSSSTPDTLSPSSVMRATGAPSADRCAAAHGRPWRALRSPRPCHLRGSDRPPVTPLASPLRRCSSVSTELFERGPRFVPSTASSASAPFSSGDLEGLFEHVEDVDAGDAQELAHRSRAEHGGCPGPASPQPIASDAPAAERCAAGACCAACRARARTRSMLRAIVGERGAVLVRQARRPRARRR